MSCGKLEIPASKNNKPCFLKSIYAISTNRFAKNRKLKTATLSCKSNIVVITGLGTKMHVVILDCRKIRNPEVRKYDFKESIVSLSAVKSRMGFTVFVLLKKDAYLIHGDGSTAYIQSVPMKIACLSEEQNEFFVYGGTTEGMIMKVGFNGSHSESLFAIGCDSGVCQMQLNNSRNLLACGFVNGTISLYSGDSLECRWSQTFHFGSIREITWSFDDSMLAFAAEDDNFNVIHPAKDWKITCVRGHRSFLNSISFDTVYPDEVRIFSSAQDAMIGCCDMSDSEITMTMLGRFKDPIMKIACFRRTIVAIDSNATIVCWRKVMTKDK